MKNMIPGIIGAGVWQLNMLVDISIASYLPTGTITCMNLADRLNQFPLATLGIALSTALLPMLSNCLATKDYNLHPKEQSNYTKIAENCYVWSSNDTRTKRAILAYIFKEIGILPSDLELMLVPVSENTVIDNVED